jgi:hypothetical protein
LTKYRQPDEGGRSHRACGEQGGSGQGCPPDVVQVDVAVTPDRSQPEEYEHQSCQQKQLRSDAHAPCARDGGGGRAEVEDTLAPRH